MRRGDVMRKEEQHKGLLKRAHPWTDRDRGEEEEQQQQETAAALNGPGEEATHRHRRRHTKRDTKIPYSSGRDAARSCSYAVVAGFVAERDSFSSLP